MKPQIGIKRLDHVCWAVWRLEDALPLLTELFGLKVKERWRDEEEGFSGCALALPGDAPGRTGAHLELLAPLGDDSFLARFLRQRGPGLHHVTFEVEDIDKAAGAIREYGIEPLGGVRRAHGWIETYIHPKDSGGVLFQFYVEDDQEGEAPK